MDLSEWGSFYWVVPVVVVSVAIIWFVDRKKYRSAVLLTMLIIWVASLIYLMFIYRLSATRQSAAHNLNVFHMYRAAAGYIGLVGENQALRQILFNMLLYIPFGAIVCVLSKKFLLTVVIGIGLSVVTEALQYWTGFGMADIDDVISNGVGLAMGASLITIMTRYRKRSSDNNRESGVRLF